MQCLAACPMSSATVAAPTGGGFVLLFSHIRLAMLSGVSCAGALNITPQATPAAQRLLTTALDRAPRGAGRRGLRRCPQHQLRQRRHYTAAFDAPVSQCYAACPALVPSASAHRPLRHQPRLCAAAFDALASRCVAACPAPVPSASAHQPLQQRRRPCTTAARPPSNTCRRVLLRGPRRT